MKTFIKNIIEKIYYKAFPNRKYEHNLHEYYLNQIKKEGSYSKLLAQIVIYNETVRDMDESQLIKLLQGMMFEQMAPKLPDCIKISSCKALTNSVTTTYRGTLKILLDPSTDKIGGLS